MTALWIYLGALNAAAFALAWADKKSARKGKTTPRGIVRRVPEKTLFLAALAGGSAGLMLAMLIFRHKTRKLRFMLGVPVIMGAQAALLWLLFRANPGLL